MKRTSNLWIILFVGLVVGGLITALTINLLPKGSTDLISPFVKQETATAAPLNEYSIPNLATRPFTASPPLKIEQLLKTTPDIESYTFSFQTMDQRMSGLVNIPTTPAPKTGYPVLLMVRGYVPLEQYVPGMGTKNAAEHFTKKGYVTIAPDFFGYGTSAPELADSWEARFIKPINLIELLKTVQAHPELLMKYEAIQVAESALKSTAPSSASSSAETTESTESAVVAPVTENPLVGRPNASISLNAKKIGIWAHSNGGQITLTALEILGEPVPATLWAPVTAPFPYSLLYFSDENEDEGKATRNWIAEFEKEYDVFDFSLTQHLDRLHGDIQIHHGTLDDSALKSWSDDFVAKIKTANVNRPKSDQVKINYFTYPGADHNLQPGWNTAIQRDSDFFQKKL